MFRVFLVFEGVLGSGQWNNRVAPPPGPHLGRRGGQWNRINTHSKIPSNPIQIKGINVCPATAACDNKARNKDCLYFVGNAKLCFVWWTFMADFNVPWIWQHWEDNNNWILENILAKFEGYKVWLTWYADKQLDWQDHFPVMVLSASNQNISQTLWSPILLSVSPDLTDNTWCNSDSVICDM